MWNQAKRVQVGLFALVLLLYTFVLLRNLHESERRSLQLQAEPQAGDQAQLSLRVLNVNPNTSEITARVAFRLTGSIAKDEVTPATDLKLFLNNVQGPQEFEFPRGRRMNPIVGVFALEGNVNRYPFDHHAAAIQVLMTRPIRYVVPAPASKEDTKKKKEKEKKAKKRSDPTQAFGELAVGAVTLQRNEPVPLAPALSASVPGLKFDGDLVAAHEDAPTTINLRIRRADNAIVVSVMVMGLMMSLALSVLLMALKALTSNEALDLLPLSLSFTLLFGLPALRNAQPGVPPLGAFGDYVSFLWAEQVVAVSAVLIMWAWLRSRRQKPEEARSDQDESHHRNAAA